MDFIRTEPLKQEPIDFEDNFNPEQLHNNVENDAVTSINPGHGNLEMENGTVIPGMKDGPESKFDPQVPGLFAHPKNDTPMKGAGHAVTTTKIKKSGIQSTLAQKQKICAILKRNVNLCPKPLPAPVHVQVPLRTIRNRNLKLCPKPLSRAGGLHVREPTSGILQGNMTLFPQPPLAATSSTFQSMDTRTDKNLIPNVSSIGVQPAVAGALSHHSKINGTGIVSPSIIVNQNNTSMSQSGPCMTYPCPPRIIRPIFATTMPISRYPSMPLGNVPMVGLPVTPINQHNYTGSLVKNVSHVITPLIGGLHSTPLATGSSSLASQTMKQLASQYLTHGPNSSVSISSHRTIPGTYENTAKPDIALCSYTNNINVNIPHTVSMQYTKTPGQCQNPIRATENENVIINMTPMRLPVIMPVQTTAEAPFNNVALLDTTTTKSITPSKECHDQSRLPANGHPIPSVHMTLLTLNTTTLTATSDIPKTQIGDGNHIDNKYVGIPVLVPDKTFLPGTSSIPSSKSQSLTTSPLTKQETYLSLGSVSPLTYLKTAHVPILPKPPKILDNDIIKSLNKISNNPKMSQTNILCGPLTYTQAHEMNALLKHKDQQPKGEKRLKFVHFDMKPRSSNVSMERNKKSCRNEDSSALKTSRTRLAQTKSTSKIKKKSSVPYIRNTRRYKFSPVANLKVIGNGGKPHKSNPDYLPSTHVCAAHSTASANTTSASDGHSGTTTTQQMAYQYSFSSRHNENQFIKDVRMDGYFSFDGDMSLLTDALRLCSVPLKRIDCNYSETRPRKCREMPEKITRASGCSSKCDHMAGVVESKPMPGVDKKNAIDLMIGWKIDSSRKKSRKVNIVRDVEEIRDLTLANHFKSPTNHSVKHECTANEYHSTPSPNVSVSELKPLTDCTLITCAKSSSSALSEEAVNLNVSTSPSVVTETVSSSMRNEPTFSVLDQNGTSTLAAFSDLQSSSLQFNLHKSSPPTIMQFDVGLQHGPDPMQYADKHKESDIVYHKGLTESKTMLMDEPQHFSSEEEADVFENDECNALRSIDVQERKNLLVKRRNEKIMLLIQNANSISIQMDGRYRCDICNAYYTNGLFRLSKHLQKHLNLKEEYDYDVNQK